MEYPDLVEVGQRPKRYWTQDGIPEIVMGGIWILVGGAFLLQDLIPADARFAEGYRMIMMLVILASFLAANWIVKAMKSKYTFPRGGYVKFMDPTRSQRILSASMGGLIGATVAILIGLSVKRPVLADIAAPAFGAMMAAGFLMASKRWALRHWVWLSLISLVLGGVLYPLKLQWMAMPWFLMLMGVPIAAAGVCRLRAYIRSVPLPGGNE